AWQGGDLRAGNTLFSRYFETVERYFANKSSGDIEDLVQQTFEACVQGRDRVRDGSSFRAYLFGVAYNVMRVAHRERRRHAAVDEPVAAVRSEAPGPSTWLGAREDARWLREGLDRLPRSLRAVLELHYLQGLSSIDIAHLVGCPEGTVRSRLRRGRKLLRAALLERNAERGAEVSADSPLPLGPRTKFEPA
ncbi:MAG: sigma-70 family RNA polymerase sigma factor, partial [Myxococcales bacterium]|nr:sigma-70 family RNA polymerase sigma factor [Myxococcales bacterium]